ncbi:MAG: hypothetical protein NZ519_05460, partial [Bacteroidia bacterium]|nr:hypothetical protein [Bacteroidia bacterium]
EVPKRSAVRNAPTLASARGTPKKIKLKIKLFFLNLLNNISIRKWLVVSRFEVYPFYSIKKVLPSWAYSVCGNIV